MSYTPNPSNVAQQMLESIGMKRMEDLFTDIPDKIKLGRQLNLGEPMAEIELRQYMGELAAKNVANYPCFLGAGAYDHYIPAVVDQVLMRSEFYTAYTPYQPELSQGILQSIFEYQTMICNLTEMDLANASMFDGGSALAEACSMASDAARCRKILVPDNINPKYLRVMNTYAISGKIEIVVVPSKDGCADAEAIAAMVDQDTAAVVLQYPNFYGILEKDLAAIEQKIHANKGLLIMAVDPIAMGILKTPAAWGADIVVGEGQSLGNPLNFGGPYLGFMATNKKFMRRIPGRLVGETKDEDGKRAFVLTLQAREQHIRREKASSNICSNEALCALAATVYLTVVGKAGLREIATRSHEMACYAQSELEKAGLKLKYQQPYFKEFALKIRDPHAANQALLNQGIIGGYELEGALLLAFTEKRSKEQIDRLVAVIGGMPA